MDHVQELIETASKLCATLERSATMEKLFCIDIQIRLEQMSWEAYRMANELKELRQYV